MILKKLNKWFIFLGFNLFKIKSSISELPSYFKDLKKMRRFLIESSSEFKISKLYPIFGEKYSHDAISWNYFFQDLYVAQLIFENKPIKHIDVGSRIDGFISNVATFREIEVYDIRVVREDIPNVKFIQADICSNEFEFCNYCDSISSLHVIEHLGLGRYGDKLDPNGYIIGLKNITRALKINGIFYLSVPIGEQRIEFNAHRVFSTKHIIHLLSPYYNIVSFSYVNDKSMFFRNIPLADKGFENDFGCYYGCGIFVLRKVNNWL